MISIWNRLDLEWPVFVGDQIVGLAGARERALAFLTEHQVIPLSFSHYGIVVTDIDTAFIALNEQRLPKSAAPQKAWVESYQVFVLRMDLEGTEMEFIEPASPSFFRDFSDKRDAHSQGGLHHVSFRVKDIKRCLAVLKDQGVELVDLTPRKGSHGKVAFTKPGPLAPLYIELCE